MHPVPISPPPTHACTQVTAPVVDAFTTVGTAVNKTLLEPTVQTVTKTTKSAKVGVDRITTRFVSIVNYDEY